VVIGWCTFDVLLGDVRSLKEKRSLIRPVLAELRRKFPVSSAETGDQDLLRRAELSVCLCSGAVDHLREVLAECERLVAGRPEFELLSARTRVLDGDDV
jgi:uncharacterized protein YlxP (DUF503 family)